MTKKHTHFDHPSYPLPEDYETLTPEGQRQARIDACRQWTLWDPLTHPHEAGLSFMRGVRLFEQHYLWPEYDESGEQVFNSYFYDLDPRTTPPFQWQRRYNYARNKCMVFAGPRGCTKTTSIAVDSIFEMVSCPSFSIVYCTVKEDLGVSFTNAKMRPQVYDNPRIQADWGPEYGVTSLRPKRNEMSTGSEHFFLANRANMKITSIGSAQRGMRPRRYKMDDPEKDSEGRMSMDVVLQQMESLLFTVIRPMIIEPGRALSWDGTFVSPRHFLWQMFETDSEFRTKDRRFNHFFRMIAPIEKPNPPEGRVLSVWPQMWPGDEIEREEMNLPPGWPTLVHLRDEELGPTVYRAEMLCQPEAGDGGHFRPNRGQHGYWIEEIDADFDTHPYRSSAKICWRDRHNEVQRRELADLVNKCGTFVTADTSYTNTTFSDFKTGAVLCIDEDFNLFVLDLWSKQCDLPEQIIELLHLAARWRASSLHPEVIREGKRLEAGLRDILANRGVELVDIDWFPSVRGISPSPTLSKQSRIDSALYLRFVRGLIKLPFDMRDKHPWNRLFNQLENFNPQIADGNLKKDDEIDTVAMVQDALKIRPAPLKPPEESLSIVDKLKQGITHDEKGDPLIVRALPILTAKDIADIAELNLSRPAPHTPSLI